ncbi:hypothetical protein PQX77_009469 [Marasmius sp. AFHP31]|nr:hypothetical protein PQX77_009469 [Marasmius sp. AFHP31]
MFKTMIRLSKNSGLHPKCLSIQNVRKLGLYPIAAGGFGDVWKGVIGDSDEQVVCLKVVKVYQTSDIEALFKDYLGEAIVWRQLEHPNLLPFLGIYHLENEHHFCLVSPWMEKGNLIQYLKATRKEDVDHLALVYDVATGLAYLHRRKVVHGDLKGVNILITPDGRACIGDFGLSRIADTHAFGMTTSTSKLTGTARWLSPERLKGNPVSTKESDVYSFGCVCYEIFTCLQPFHELRDDIAVILQVIGNNRPKRPRNITELTDDMWSIMQSCWHSNPSSRPTAAVLLDEVEKIISREHGGDLTPAPDWSDSMFSRIWENVKRPSLSVGGGDWGAGHGNGVSVKVSNLPNVRDNAHGESHPGHLSGGTGLEQSMVTADGGQEQDVLTRPNLAINSEVQGDADEAQGEGSSDSGSSRGITPMFEGEARSGSLSSSPEHVSVTADDSPAQKESEWVRHRGSLKIYQHSRSPSPTPFSSPMDVLHGQGFAHGIEEPTIRHDDSVS